MSSSSRPSDIQVARIAREANDVRTLLNVLNRGEQRARALAARYLGELKSPEAVPDLARALRAGDQYLRVLAANALAATGGVDGLGDLQEAAERDDSVLVRCAATTALLELSPDDALDPLLAIATSRDPGERRARRWAIRELRRMGSKRHLATLEADLRTRPVLERVRSGRMVRLGCR